METHAVTGAFGYSGKYIARRLLDRGLRVVTLTNSPGRPHPFGDALAVRPLDFANPGALARSLEGVSVLYNTYWVRFNHPLFSHADAVRNTLALFDAARRAGVRRIVHVSITNPSEDSPFEYFRGKAVLERALGKSGLSHGILRPAVLFGHEDILVNNIAWALRRFPVFGVFGDGEYRIQPIHVEDFADCAAALGESSEDRTVEAIGPETFTYRGLVEAVGAAIGVRRPVIRLSPGLGHLAGLVIGRVVGDVFITREEIGGLMADLLHVEAPPAGATRLTEWARAHADTLGRRYASELARRVHRDRAYGDLTGRRPAP